MRSPVRPAFVALALLLAAGIAAAEPTGSYLTITPFGGYTVFDGKFRTPRFPTDTIPTSTLGDKVNVGGRLGYQFSRWAGIELAAGYTPTQLENPKGPKVKFLHGSLDLKLTPFQGRYGGPFLLIGGAGRRLKVEGSSTYSAGGLDAGAGLDFWMTDALGIRVEGRDMYWADRDNHLQSHSHTFVFGGGITMALGGTPRDTDGDGVPDRKDKCKDTPHGATVDANGCPGDADGDGVLDGLDQCANTPKGATVDAKGCPSDADGDGVWDGLDQCADTPKGATVDAKGCTSDADGDGVLDGIDQCPDTPKGATIDAKGCPTDSDHDGVYDGLDKCPDTAAGLKVDKDGCPIEITERETELLDTGSIVLRDVNFETAKANILPDSYHSLDIVGQILSKWPELKIEIGGHTDSRGSNAYNQKLSEARVDSVLAYIIAKFPALKREQFTTKGYGESKPLVPNTNPLNMARNRRVEFKVLNREVLKHEMERRKLLKEGDTPTKP